MVYARLSAVYGLSYESINTMPLAAITAYLERIPAITAERKLITGEAASVPWTKNPSRTLKAWQQQAYGSSSRPARPATPGMLKLIGIGVVRVGNKPR